MLKNPNRYVIACWTLSFMPHICDGILDKLGFVFSHQRGSHLVFKHPDGRRTTMPHHSKEELGPGLLTKIIKKDLQITREEFFEYLK